jgi:putative ABC transport system permease protein
MRALQRKLFRDLWSLRAQLFAIMFVTGGGIATLVMCLSTLDALMRARADFYVELRFPDVFATLERAPETVISSLLEVRGVERAESRVVSWVKLEVPDFGDPVSARVVSLPEDLDSGLNGVSIQTGRLPLEDATREIVIGEPFAEAHGLVPGDRLVAVINGKREDFWIVGIGLSAEFVYQVPPGALIPDYSRFTVAWMPRRALAVAEDMEGAFNDVLLSLARGAVEDDVISAVDEILVPYGGRGAHGRDEQLSHKYLSDEFEQLRTMARIFPTVFLGVAAFLLSIVLRRLIDTQRGEIAVLKAFGHANATIGFHYSQFVLCIATGGLILGLGGGFLLGTGLCRLYRTYYRLPTLEFGVSIRSLVLAGGVCVVAAAFGTWRSVRAAVLLPPALAMRVDPPTGFRKIIVDRLGLGRWISQPTRMIARNIERRPLKSLLSIVAISFAEAILMVGMFQKDAIDYIVGVQFAHAQRNDLTVTFLGETSASALEELASIDGVHFVEPFRFVPCRIERGHRSQRVNVQGVRSRSDLVRVIDDRLTPIAIPPGGVVLSEYLGRRLDAPPGEIVHVHVLDGKRVDRDVPVAAWITEFIGTSAYMEIGALGRLLGEDVTVNGAWLAVDEAKLDAVYDALRARPRVAGIGVREQVIRNFYDTIAETLLVFAFFNSLLAGSIAFGTVYNSSRIALSERERELASLRVLGYTRAEVSYILLGEIAVFTLLAVPVGWALGRALVEVLSRQLQSELYRIPPIVEPSTYAFSASVVLVATFVSGIVIARKIYGLDLIASLKMRE